MRTLRWVVILGYLAFIPFSIYGWWKLSPEMNPVMSTWHRVPTASWELSIRYCCTGVACRQHHTVYRVVPPVSNAVQTFFEFKMVEEK